MDYRELAEQANTIAHDMPYSMRRMHGIEVAPGWFNIYNEKTGQSKRVLYHEGTGMLFKTPCYAGYSAANLSNKFLGYVTFDDVTYPVRLPFFQQYPLGGERFVEVQEYILGINCGCDEIPGSYTCRHSDEVRRATGERDAHWGNWKIWNGEVVLFDFEGLS